MPVRGLLVAIVVLGVLAGGVYWSEKHKAAEEAKEASGGAAKLVTVKDDDVQKIEIHRRESAPVIIEARQFEAVADARSRDLACRSGCGERCCLRIHRAYRTIVWLMRSRQT